MGKGFLKFKRKVSVDALIKGVASGLSLGLIVFSVLYILKKREIITLHPAFCVLIGVGVAIAVGTAVYFLFKPRDKRLAKRLDKELGLNEKVQTMIAFEGNDEAMKQLQREDADARLSALPLSKMRFGNIWKYALMTLLAVVTFTGSFFVPAKQPPKPVDPPFNLSEWQKLSLENLIEYVESSEMIDEAKGYTVQQLENLVVALDETERESVMKSHVVSAIVNVDKKLDQVNSYTTLRRALGETADNDLIKLANALKTLQNSASVEAFEDFRGIFVYATFTDTVSKFKMDVEDALADCGYDSSDGLYASVEGFLSDLQDLSDGIGEHTEETFEAALNGSNGIGGIFTDFAQQAHTALSQQKKNRQVFDYVKEELMKIFELTNADIPDLGEEELEYQGKGDEDDEDNPPAPGGIGPGGTEYASNDMIFDPDKGYVLYGDVLNDYEARMDDILNDDSIPQEIKDKIRDYFNSL